MTESEVKGILVTFFRDGTKGDYIEALNEATKKIMALHPVASWNTEKKTTVEVIMEAKRIYLNKSDNQRKLSAVKYMMANGWGLKEAHEYCLEHFNH